MVHVVVLEPHPPGQRPFLRGLKRAGCRVSGIGSLSPTGFDGELRYLLDGYALVADAADEVQVSAAVARLGASGPRIDRIEGTTPEVVRAAAAARGELAGPSVEVVALTQDLQRFHPHLAGLGVATAERPVGHEGYLDALVVRGEVVHEAVTHFYPPTAEALSDRTVAPLVVHTNRLSHDGYDALRAIHRTVIGSLPLETTATHLEWFHGPDGLGVVRFGLHPPPWDLWELYGEAGEFDLYLEWAKAVAYGDPTPRPRSRRAAGVVNLRPDRDGVISHYEGVEAMQRKHGALVFRMHLPPAGTPTQPIALGYHANAYIGVEHDDYDVLREILDDLGRTVRVFASEYAE